MSHTTLVLILDSVCTTLSEAGFLRTHVAERTGAVGDIGDWGAALTLRWRGDIEVLRCAVSDEDPLQFPLEHTEVREALAARA